jgi:hypothetical protein
MAGGNKNGTNGAVQGAILTSSWQRAASCGPSSLGCDIVSRPGGAALRRLQRGAVRAQGSAIRAPVVQDRAGRPAGRGEGEEGGSQCHLAPRATGKYWARTMTRTAGVVSACGCARLVWVGDCDDDNAINDTDGG